MPNPSLSVRGRLLLGSELVPGTVVVEDGRITRIDRLPADAPVPGPILEAGIVAPGFVDLQVNGGFGVEVGEDPSAIRQLAARLPSTGVTGFLPTAVSSPPDFYERLYRSFAQARAAPGAHPLGLHLEGPFLSPARHGAHRRDAIEAAEPDLLDRLLEEDGLRVMTVAPERSGALEWIERLRRRGVTVSLGHTNASYEELERGVDAGASMVTHLFNAMSPFEHRSPNAVGAALVDDRLTVSLIADGVHTHPAAVRLALKAKGAERVALVTDMMPAAGMPPGSFQLGGQRVVVDGSSARLEDGTLAGSTLTLDQAVRNVVRWDAATPAQALRMASEVPARLLGLDHTGRIEVGLDADLVLLDGDLWVQSTIIKGERVYPPPES